MATISMILLVLAFALFLIAGFARFKGSYDLIALGLASWALSVLLGGVSL